MGPKPPPPPHVIKMWKLKSFRSHDPDKSSLQEHMVELRPAGKRDIRAAVLNAALLQTLIQIQTGLLSRAAWLDS